ncbi:MAG: hypothetical protein ACOCV7_06100, partial [Desulfonatronovibrionaceae bacterium]
MKKWEKFFTESKSFDWSDKTLPLPKFKINNIFGLKKFLDMVHIRQCLIRPFLTSQAYPLVESRELLPSFESDLYEYENLPGFSLVAFDRQLDYFNEVFQFDIIHNCWEKSSTEDRDVCPLFRVTHQNNLSTVQSRLPRNLQEPFAERFFKQVVTRLINYPSVLDFILEMDRGHVMALNARNE